MLNELTSGNELDFEKELDEAQRSLREVTLMMEQSQGELSKLTQRHAAITTHLQQVQNQLDKMPPQEVKSAYESALDAQQRLFVMRGQLEKLQTAKELCLVDRTASPPGEGLDSDSETTMTRDYNENTSGTTSSTSSQSTATKYNKSDTRPIISRVAQAMLAKYGSVVTGGGVARVNRV